MEDVEENILNSSFLIKSLGGGGCVVLRTGGLRLLSPRKLQGSEAPGHWTAEVQTVGWLPWEKQRCVRNTSLGYPL